MPLSFMMHAFIIFCLTIYLHFLPLMNVFKITALFISLIYFRELFFTTAFFDPIEGGMIYKKQITIINNSKITLKKVCLIQLLMVRLNNKVFLLLGDVESRYDLLKKYINQYHSGGVKNWWAKRNTILLRLTMTFVKLAVFVIPSVLPKPSEKGREMPLQ